MTEPLIVGRQLGVRRGGRTILTGADLTLEPGKIVTLIGPNGAGKTTLVRCVLGLIRPDAGSLERRPGLRVGYMPQRLHIDPSLPISVSRFLTLGGRARLPLEQVLALTGIEHLTRASMSHLSGGETQRVLLARALLRDPNLLVLDEPVQGVDVTGQEALYQLINDIRQQRQCGVLLVSHDLHLVMATTDTVICLNQHVCCYGHPNQITSDPAYLALFGNKAGALVAPYTHHHDHEHDDRGNIVKPSQHNHGPHNHA